MPGTGRATSRGKVWASRWTNGRKSRVATAKVRFHAGRASRDMDARASTCTCVHSHAALRLSPGAAQGRQLARASTNEIAAMTRQWPQQFAGLATLPVQDVKAAIGRARPRGERPRLKGAELDTVVNGANWDEPQFPAASSRPPRAMGAVLFFHPSPSTSPVQGHRPATVWPTAIASSSRRRADRRDPHLRRDSRRLSRPPGVHRPRRRSGLLRDGRLDHGWRVRSERRQHIRAPSAYLRRLYYERADPRRSRTTPAARPRGRRSRGPRSDWPFVVGILAGGLVQGFGA